MTMDMTIVESVCRTRVKAEIIRHMRSSSLGVNADKYLDSVGLGKMLRAQLVYCLGLSVDAPDQRLLSVAAAVEMIHGGSLLHDDVIDGAALRRGAPSFWSRHGVQGAILFGDTLLVEAMRLISEQSDNVLMSTLIEMLGELCMAEVEQELVLRGNIGNWDQCVSLARRKTGSLFAFSASAVSSCPDCKAALAELGYLAGTAYQLADDVLDTAEDHKQAGKSLGTDRQRGKTTALTAYRPEGMDPVDYIKGLCDRAGEQVNQWPELKQAWNSYLQQTLWPVIASHLTHLLHNKSVKGVAASE